MINDQAATENRSPEKAGVDSSILSLGTTYKSITYEHFQTQE